MTKYIRYVCLLAGAACAQQQTITLNAPTPTPVGSVSAQASTSGLGYYCYWVAAIYPIGKAYPTGPSCVSNAAGTVTVNWSPASGATGYDVLRTTSPSLPSGAAAIAVATAVSGTSQTDNLGSLSSYTVSAASPAVANISLDNRTNAQPRLTVDTPFNSAKFYTLQFGDGTSQTTAGGGSGSGVTYCAPASSSSTAYTCSPTPALTSYAAGASIAFKPDVTSGSSPTVNVSSLGAKNLKTSDGSTAVAAGQLIAGKVYILTYDGTSFLLPDEGISQAPVLTGGTLVVRAPECRYGTIDLSAVFTNSASQEVSILTSVPAAFRYHHVLLHESTTVAGTPTLTVSMGQSSVDTDLSGTALSLKVGTTNYLYETPRPPALGSGTYNVVAYFTSSTTMGNGSVGNFTGIVTWEVCGWKVQP